MNKDILKKDGLSLEKLKVLSYRSKLDVHLKRNLHYFEKDILFHELNAINEWYDTSGILDDIVTDYRLKAYNLPS